MHAIGTCSRYFAKYAASKSLKVNFAMPESGEIAPTLMFTAVGQGLLYAENH